MDFPWVQLGLVAVLVVLNAAFAGSELALVSLREGQLRRMERRSGTGRVLARLARDPNRFLATIQIGITLAGFLASASAAVSLAEPLEEPLDVFGAAARPVSVVTVTVLLSYATLVLGELAPKRLAMQRAERWGLISARPLAAMASASRPVVWLLSRSTDLVVRVLGGDPSREREEVTVDELRDLIRSKRSSFTPQHRRIIDGAFEISERTIKEVMKPRPDVFVLDAAAPCPAAREELASSGHSRAPVAVEGSLDELVGVVHLRDLLEDAPGTTAGSVSSPAKLFPETAEVLAVLREMQRGHVQLAVVVDEHGATEGIVTVEDLVEELVGEIWDETDLDPAEVRHLADDSVVVSGRLPVHDLPDLGVEVPEGSYTTIAGFMLAELQRLPDAPGDEVLTDRWRFRVTAVDERAIIEVRISPRSRTPEDG